jgi:predicted nucleic acid-binding protein
VIRVFVDTSAILALLIASDVAHPSACRAFERLKEAEASLVTTSYVLVDTYALLGRRIGMSAVADFRERFAPLLEVIWVDAALHEQALDALLADGRSDSSLVDSSSFIAARQQQVDAVFAFDRHFEEAGFTTI